jgi:hypothetical protein
MTKKYESDPEVVLPTMIPYSEQIYPKKSKERKDVSDRIWRIDYNLIYDDGTLQFSQYYRTRFGALWSAFWHEHLRSWGGSAVLIHQPSEPKDPRRRNR